LNFLIAEVSTYLWLQVWLAKCQRLHGGSRQSKEQNGNISSLC